MPIGFNLAGGKAGLAIPKGLSWSFAGEK